ncbi:hypothetical protein MTO96_044549, partial [Rhipicephalus appendiculatus]
PGESVFTDRRLLPPNLLRRHIKNPGPISRMDNAPIVIYVIETSPSKGATQTPGGPFAQRWWLWNSGSSLIAPV